MLSSFVYVVCAFLLSKHSQAADGGTDAIDDDVHTFVLPDSSYLEYRLDWLLSKNQQFVLQFAFRTIRASTFLLHQSYRESELTVCKMEVLAKLRNGVLVVYQLTNRSQAKSVRIGKGGSSWYIIYAMIIDE